MIFRESDRLPSSGQVAPFELPPLDFEARKFHSRLYHYKPY